MQMKEGGYGYIRWDGVWRRKLKEREREGKGKERVKRERVGGRGKEGEKGRVGVQSALSSHSRRLKCE